MKMHEHMERTLARSRTARLMARALDASQASYAASLTSKGYFPDTATALAVIKRFDPRAEDPLPLWRVRKALTGRSVE